jgi:hypothetical protein
MRHEIKLAIPEIDDGSELEIEQMIEDIFNNIKSKNKTFLDFLMGE